METITACENVCRDFSWFPPVIGVVANLATIAAVLLAFQQWFSWRSQRISLQKSELALELIVLCRDLLRVCKKASSYYPIDISELETIWAVAKSATRFRAELDRLRRGIQTKQELFEILENGSSEISEKLECILELSVRYADSVDMLFQLADVSPEALEKHKDWILERGQEIGVPHPSPLISDLEQQVEWVLPALARIVRFERGMEKKTN